ncbi:MAG: response regulator, partial [Bacteroidota bacterium]
MKTLNAIIVDDEELGRKNLEQLLKDYCPEVRVAGMAKSVVEARQLVFKHRPEIVFLDIHMPRATGFDLLNSLEERDFATIFVTAYRDFGIKALKAGALDYLMKPVDFRELQLAVHKVYRQLNDRRNTRPPLAP